MYVERFNVTTDTQTCMMICSIRDGHSSDRGVKCSQKHAKYFRFRPIFTWHRHPIDATSLQSYWWVHITFCFFLDLLVCVCVCVCVCVWWFLPISLLGLFICFFLTLPIVRGSVLHKFCWRSSLILSHLWQECFFKCIQGKAIRNKITWTESGHIQSGYFLLN
jgi:hypothetical protein